MTTISFPETKEDYTAPNGVTYYWKDDTHWAVKTFKIDESVLGDYVTEEDFNEGQAAQDTVINEGLATQREIGNTVDTLENKVNALEGSIIDAIWTFEEDDRIPRAGEFALRTGGNGVTGDFAAATVIILNTTDNDGNTYTFERITVGDVIRLGAADGSGAEYRITTLLGGGSFGVEHLRSTPQAADEIPYAFTFLSSFDPQGLATIAYVDAQDNLKLNLTGGTMQGPLGVETEPAADDSATAKTYVDNLAATNLALVWAQNYATEDYVDQAIADIDLDEGGGGGGGDYLPLTGGTVDGLLTVNFSDASADNAYVLNVQGSRLPEGQTSAFRVTAGGSVKAGHSSSTPFLASANNDVITKAYLDAGYYTKPESDQAASLGMKRFGNNDVATGAENEANIFRIRGIRAEGNYFTAVSIDNDSMGLYNLREPQESHHAATKNYVDNAEYLPLSGGTLSDRLFFERRSGMNMIISPNASDTSSSIYACNGGAIRFRSLPDENVNNSSTHLSLGKLDDGQPGTYIYHLQDPEDELWAANKRYVDRQVQGAIDGFSTSERFYTIKRGNTAQPNSVTFYESSGFFYYYIDVRPETGRVIGAPGNFGFKDCALPFKIGWIQSTGVENIMVSAVATLIRKTTAGSTHVFQVAVDPSRDDCLIHDPYTVPQDSTVVCTLAGII